MTKKSIREIAKNVTLPKINNYLENHFGDIHPDDIPSFFVWGLLRDMIEAGYRIGGDPEEGGTIWQQFSKRHFTIRHNVEGYSDIVINGDDISWFPFNKMALLKDDNFGFYRFEPILKILQMEFDFHFPQDGHYRLFQHIYNEMTK